MKSEPYWGILLNPRSPNCCLEVAVTGGPFLFGRKGGAKIRRDELLAVNPTLKCRVIKVDCVYEMPR